ncbi:MAG: hypothetical protein IJT58_07545 [Synergistaceae bacterium]|nr:hypothetical protein [Synergistaceae bacterium]
MRRLSRFIIILAVISALAGVSHAFIREGAIRGRKGLSFSNVQYAFDNVTLTVSNRTKYNVSFGGSMLFLDRHHRLVARAEVMKGKIKRHSSRRYKAFFTYGTGNEARSASFLEWEF